MRSNTLNFNLQAMKNKLLALLGLALVVFTGALTSCNENEENGFKSQIVVEGETFLLDGAVFYLRDVSEDDYVDDLSSAVTHKVYRFYISDCDNSDAGNPLTFEFKLDLYVPIGEEIGDADFDVVEYFYGINDATDRAVNLSGYYNLQNSTCTDWDYTTPAEYVNWEDFAPADDVALKVIGDIESTLTLSFETTMDYWTYSNTGWSDGLDAPVEVKMAVRGEVMDFIRL